MTEANSLATQITVSIVTYNSAAVIGECLQRIPDSVRVLVFDNASTDNSVTLARQCRPNSEITVSSANVGFGRGHNANLANATTPYVLILNPDCFLSAASLEALVAALSNDAKTAIAGPVLDGHGINQFSGETPIEVDAGISGACLALRREAFSQIGFFDPELFLFYEDKDLCTKARLAGYKLVIVPQAKGEHLPGNSSGRNTSILLRRGFYMGWSEAYYKCKYRPSRAKIWTVSRIIARHLASAFCSVCLLKPMAVDSLSRVIGSMCYGIAGSRRQIGS